MNLYLAEARTDLQRAARKAEQARIAYNAAVQEWKAQRQRYERLEFAELEERLKLDRERQKAEAEGNHALAVLLQPR